MSSEFLPFLVCILAFVGFLRVFRFARLFWTGVVIGYREYRFQRMSDNERIIFLRRNINKSRRSADRWMKLAKFLRHKKAVERLETKLNQIALAEDSVNKTADAITKFQADVSAYVLSIGQTPIPEIPAPLPYKQTSTTIH